MCVCLLQWSGNTLSLCHSQCFVQQTSIDPCDTHCCGNWGHSREKMELLSGSLYPRGGRGGNEFLKDRASQTVVGALGVKGRHRRPLCWGFFFFFGFNFFLILIFYCYSVTVVCLFSPSLHRTPARKSL